MRTATSNPSVVVAPILPSGGKNENPRLDERGSRDLCYVVAIEHFTLRRREPQGVVARCGRRYQGL